jgi:hypothetical protein
MLVNNVRQSVFVGLAVLCGIVTASQPAAAEQLSISSVHPDVASGVLVVDGTGFRPGAYVGLETYDLKVLSLTSHQIKTNLPASIKPGSYRLNIRQWHNDDARFIVTIGGGGGAAGPQGAPGPMGPVGPMGPKGTNGTNGPAGPQGFQGTQGPQGLQGPKGDQGPAGPAGANSPAGLQVIAHNGATLGSVVGVGGFNGPAVVARQDNGTWIAIAIDTAGVVPSSFPVFYTQSDCTGDAYALFESSPVPLIRSLQLMLPNDTTAYYPGDPATTMSFPTMLAPDPANPAQRKCVSAPASGWGGDQYVGPLKTVDLTAFPAPFTIQ